MSAPPVPPPAAAAAPGAAPPRRVRLAGGERRKRKRENRRALLGQLFASQPRPVLSGEEEEEYARALLDAQYADALDRAVPGRKPNVMPATCIEELPPLWSNIHTSMDGNETVNMLHAYVASKGLAHCIRRCPNPDPYHPQLGLDMPAAQVMVLQLEFTRELLLRGSRGTRMAELLKAGQ
jgi:hypothetical protein